MEFDARQDGDVRTVTLPAPRLVLLGDSLTHFGDWPALLPAFDVLNFGVSGNTSQQLYERIDPPLQSSPDLVAVMIGTNDLGLAVAEPAVVAENLERIVAPARAAAPVIVQSVLPREVEYAESVGELNRLLRASAERLGVRYLDLWPAFADRRGALAPELTTDGLHLSPSGYLVWADLLLPALTATLPTAQRPGRAGREHRHLWEDDGYEWSR
jgi:lysophospholipase L1-like esterase